MRRVAQLARHCARHSLAQNEVRPPALGLRHYSRTALSCGVASLHVPSVAEAESSGFGPVTAAVSLLEHVHLFTGLPWWLSIALSTCCVRGALLPLAVLQARANVALSRALAAARAQGIDTRSPAKLGAFLRAHRASSPSPPPSAAWVLVAPLAQIPVFVTALMAVRRAALQPAEGMSVGGAFWFADLTQPALDLASVEAPLGALGCVLPAAAVGLMFLNVQQAFGNAAAQPRALGHYRLFLEWLMVPTLAAGLMLPQAVFAYWIPSNAWTLVQGAALRRMYAAAPPTEAAPQPQTPSDPDAQPQPQSADAQPAPAHPLDEEARRLMAAAAAHRAAGQLDAAAESLAAARAVAPSHPRVAFASAQLASLRCDWSSAARDYAAASVGEQEALQRGRAHFGLGVALHMQAKAEGRPLEVQPARDAFLAASRERPDDARPHLALAALLRGAGRLQEARQAAAKAAQLDSAAQPQLAELDAALQQEVSLPMAGEASPPTQQDTACAAAVDAARPAAGTGNA